ncbi:MAG: hypothetical protein C4547_04350 [Phycisphaerales bacterium]|nr:MAG: hypothetical protein C4547_04350 [Phycisphaerales bacterium]
MRIVHAILAGAAAIGCIAAALLGPGCTVSPPADDGLCRSDADCDDGVFCNGREVCQSDGTCADGPPCESDICPDCVCSESLRLCTMIPPCASSTDCDDGLFCNGQEQCVDGGCVPGEPVDCGDDPCSEALRACERCLCESDEDCTDGVFCNGQEVCEDCACRPGAPPCPEGEECDELTGECSACPCDSDADCDDGLICNGTETCVACACLAGEPLCPTENPRTGDFCNACDEELGGCLAPCVSDEECDDGAFCNGQETCDGCSCLTGTPPCPEGACDEEADACMGE